jgi:hypothetical protein
MVFRVLIFRGKKKSRPQEVRKHFPHATRLANGYPKIGTQFSGCGRAGIRDPGLRVRIGVSAPTTEKYPGGGGNQAINVCQCAGCPVLCRRETMAGIQVHPGGAEEDPRSIAGNIAKSVRTASRRVHPGWTEPKSSGDPGEVSKRAIEAQIAAAALGRKPLYFEPWGEELSEAFAAAYRKVLPAGVSVRAEWHCFKRKFLKIS